MQKGTPNKEKTRKAFSALSDRSRFKMFEMIARKNGLCVSEIASALKISVPAASQQFRILEEAGLVERERMGQMICYKVRKKDKIIRSILQIIK